MPDGKKIIADLTMLREHYAFYESELRTIDDAIALLKEQQQQIWELQDQVEYLTDKQKEQKFFVDESGKITPLPVIIRCKDCVNNGTSRCPCHYSGDPHIDWEPDDDWFCADGERIKT